MPQRTVILIAIAAVLFVVLIATRLGGVPGLSDDPEPVALPPAVELPVGDSPTARAVAAELPRTFAVAGVTVVEAARADVDAVDARDDSGRGYEVDVDRRFNAASARDLTQLTARRTAHGRYWIADDTTDLQSLYFQSDDRIGMWVGFYPAGGPRVGFRGMAGLADRIAMRIRALRR